MNDDDPWSLPEDGLSERLAALANRIAATLGEAVHVRRDDRLSSVAICPRREGTCCLSWIELGSDEILLEVSHGGRWELLRDADDVDLLERIVEAVVAGRVVEVFALARSAVTVTLADGSEETSSVSEALRGCLPLPGWSRWGREVHYLPYAER